MTIKFGTLKQGYCTSLEVRYSFVNDYSWAASSCGPGLSAGPLTPTSGLRTQLMGLLTQLKAPHNAPEVTCTVTWGLVTQLEGPDNQTYETLYANSRTHVWANLSIHLSIYLSVCIYVYIDMYMHTYIASIHAYIHCIHTYTHTYTKTHIYIYMYIH